MMRTITFVAVLLLTVHTRGAGNPAALSRVFNRFTCWHTARTVLQVINFGVLLWAVVALVHHVHRLTN
jgi:hypothetical protein